MNQDQIKSQKLIEKDVLDRLEEELKELNDRLYKLNDVLYTDKEIITVRPIQAILMKDQYDAMYKYRNLLKRRIENILRFLETDDDDIGEDKDVIKMRRIVMKTEGEPIDRKL